MNSTASPQTERFRSKTKLFLSAFAVALLLAVVAFAVRTIGLRRFDGVVAAAAERGVPMTRADLQRSSVNADDNAALALRELIARVDDRDLQFEPDFDFDASDPRVADALADMAAAADWEDMPYDAALPEATGELLEHSQPSEAARVLVASWLAELDDELAAVDRVCARPAWAFERHGTPKEVQAERLHDTVVLLDVVPWVSVAAVQEADQGDPEAALERIRQALHLAAGQAEDPSCTSFPVFAFFLGHALLGLERVLERIPPGQDLSQITIALDRLDTMAVLRRNALFSRCCYVDDYRDDLIAPGDLELVPNVLGGMFGVDDLGPRFSLLQRWTYGVTRGFDAARFVRLSEEALDALDRSHAEALDALRATESDVAPWYAPTAPVVASWLTRSLDDCVRVEARLRLARIAVVDYTEGRAASLALAGNTADPANDAPISYRAEDDGGLTLWCGGATEGAPQQTGPGEHDVTWLLAARE